MIAESRPDVDGAWTSHRAYVTDVAFRILGDFHDAEDVVQEGFARLAQQDLVAIDDVRGWLVVVVTRLCLDQLRSARRRREMISAASEGPRDVVIGGPESDPAERITLEDQVGLALLVVLQQLSPAERAVFVLHDVFHFSFEAVAGMVGRSAPACRQLARRARHHVSERTVPVRFSPGPVEHQEIAQRFIAACAGGDLDALVNLLDPDVAGDVDSGPGVPRRPLQGRQVIAPRMLGFFGHASGAALVSLPVNGFPGVLAFRDGRLTGVIELQVRAHLVHHIHVVNDPSKLVALRLGFDRRRPVHECYA